MELKKGTNGMYDENELTFRALFNLNADMVKNIASAFNSYKDGVTPKDELERLLVQARKTQANIEGLMEDLELEII